MSEKVNRLGHLQRVDVQDGASPGEGTLPSPCPCCGLGATNTGPVQHQCPVCAYPNNTAAWVQYDGCC